MKRDTSPQYVPANGRDIPHDETLPGVAVLLDPQWLRHRLDDHVDGVIEACEVTYVRYKPETSCIVTYALRCTHPQTGATSDLIVYGKCYSPADFANALQKMNTKPVVTGPWMPPFIPLPEQYSIVYVFPNDPELPGLSIISTPKRVQRLLYEHLSGYSSDEWRISDRRIRTTPIRYKPEKRAVLRLDTRAIHRSSGAKKPLTLYMRFYCDDRGEKIFSLMEGLYDSLEGHPRVVVPRPVVYKEDRRMIIMEALPGVPLTGELAGPQAGSFVERSARALVELHRLDPERAQRRSTTDLMEDARATGRSITRVAPALGPKVDGILESLASRAPSDGTQQCFVHGDFYDGQVLISDDGEALLDFDRSYRGDALADVGNFCAHLHLCVANANGLSDVFARAYTAAAGEEIDEERLRFWTGFGLFQLAVRPFRTLEPDWSARVERVLQECEETLV